jgi:osmotically-inducible protein OsmY
MRDRRSVDGYSDRVRGEGAPGAQHKANLTRLGVVSREAIVYLSGTVESGEQKEKAETVARSVPGVKRLVSTLEVRSQ